LKKKKPTNKQVETVISNIIQQLQYMEQKVNALDNLMGLYFEWKKDTKEFNKFVQARVKEVESKNKTGDKEK
jgi:hypothetical protein